jgi:hydrogenase-1 operon protein HyaF
MRPEPKIPLASIGIAVEFESGNVPLLLNELRHALERLLADGTPHAIDVRAIPLAPGEEQRLLGALGEGELVAQLEAQGRSEIRESAYPGIWCITHYDAAGSVVGRFIEVTFMPALLASQRPDVELGLARLSRALGQSDGAGAPEAHRTDEGMVQPQTLRRWG